MIARIEPKTLSGEVHAIASKSMAHRLVIAAALANGPTEVLCNTTCDDIDATLDCLETLGARIERRPGVFEIHPIPQSREHGILRALAGRTLDCRESGSTLRFMLPVACALGADATFTGAPRLGERPLTPLTGELMAAGCDITTAGGFPLTARGRMRAGTFVLPGNVSSQYVSGLLLALPLLGQESTVEVHGTLESKPYVDLTLEALAAFGVRVRVESDPEAGITRYLLRGDSYRTPGRIQVEGDWSNAAFWFCAAAIGRRPITVRGLSLASVQGDRTVLAALSRFGARVNRATAAATVRPDKLHGFTLSAQDVPDLVPVLSAVAACCEGTTTIRDCARLRLKESDRLATTAATLNALGARVRVAGDDLIIEGVPELTGGTVDACRDHRIAMTAAVAAVRATGPVEIRGAEAVAKSYPTFFDDYRALGGIVEIEEG